MRSETKFIVGIIVITIALIVGGVFFLGRSKPQQTEAVVDKTVLTQNVKNVLGEQTAKVQIVEFGDYQCPACAAADPIVNKVLQNNKDKVYFAFRHYPLPQHQNAREAAYFAQSAAIQGKFWEMHNMLYENQKDWENSDKAKEIFTGYAQKIGLNIDKLNQDLEGVKGIVDQDFSDGNKLGVDSTPTFFINGQKYPGVIAESQFQDIINRESSK